VNDDPFEGFRVIRHAPLVMGIILHEMRRQTIGTGSIRLEIPNTDLELDCEWGETTVSQAAGTPLFEAEQAMSFGGRGPPEVTNSGNVTPRFGNAFLKASLNLNDARDPQAERISAGLASPGGASSLSVFFDRKKGAGVEAGSGPVSTSASCSIRVREKAVETKESKRPNQGQGRPLKQL
jgi:hypothetical protein